MKRMVNVLFAGVLAMTVLSCGEEKKGYTLNGEISDVKDGMVYLKNIRIIVHSCGFGCDY